MNVNEEKLNRAEKALYEVVDPELMVNIMDLGLVYEINFRDANQIHVLMTLTSPFCPMGEAITKGAKNALEKEFPGMEVAIELSTQPAWNYDYVSAEGMKQLQNR